jgi:hypothetical protein
MHECAAEGRTGQVPTRLLRCGAHWRRVPRPLRDAVDDARGRRELAADGGAGARSAAAVEAHEAAKAAAVAAVAGRGGG